jgi:hypothetical protein
MHIFPGPQVYGAVNDNWPTVEPYFNETGSNGPSVLPLNQQRELADLAVKTVQALGFTMVGPGFFSCIAGPRHGNLKFWAAQAELNAPGRGRGFCCT